MRLTAHFKLYMALVIFPLDSAVSKHGQESILYPLALQTVFSARAAPKLGGRWPEAAVSRAGAVPGDTVAIETVLGCGWVRGESSGSSPQPPTPGNRDPPATSTSGFPCLAPLSVSGRGRGVGALS